MYIKELSVSNFRNYDNAYINLSNGLNVFEGQNAQGKTNLLEAIYICAIGKSNRTSKIKDCINWSKSFSIIDIKVQKKIGTIHIQFKILENGKKIILINGSPIKSLSQLLGEINIIYFFPDDLKLIKEAPNDRRKFMDIDISQASKIYFNNLMKYNLALAQRNKLLKSAKTLTELEQTINIWDEQLSSYASKIIMSRIRFLAKLAPLAEKSHFELSNNQETLKISYQGETGDSVDEIKNKLLKLYKENLEKDYNLGYTSIGPHKDDIYIELNGVDLRSFGSQGQQRTASLALKFAEIELFKSESGEEPIILLDDVLSELDEKRRQNLIKMSEKLQTIITCTEYTENAKNAQVFKIKSGKITKN